MVAKQLKSLQELVETLIDDGATSVEQVHMSIASMPFDMLEKISVLEKPVNKVRTLHDETIGNIYETIRLVNDKAGEIARELLSKVEKK
jgi:hypothetical protein